MSVTQETKYVPVVDDVDNEKECVCFAHALADHTNRFAGVHSRIMSGAFTFDPFYTMNVNIAHLVPLMVLHIHAVAPAQRSCKTAVVPGPDDYLERLSWWQAILPKAIESQINTDGKPDLRFDELELPSFVWEDIVNVFQIQASQPTHDTFYSRLMSDNNFSLDEALKLSGTTCSFELTDDVKKEFDLRTKSLVMRVLKEVTDIAGYLPVGTKISYLAHAFECLYKRYNTKIWLRNLKVDLEIYRKPLPDGDKTSFRFVATIIPNDMFVYNQYVVDILDTVITVSKSQGFDFLQTSSRTDAVIQICVAGHVCSVDAKLPTVAKAIYDVLVDHVGMN